MEHPKLSIVPVTFNSAEHIEGTIEALALATKGIPAEIVIVDNASSDDTVERASAVLHDNMGIVALEDNVGFGPGANEGIRRARGEYTLVMNDDVHPAPGSLEMLIEVLESDQSIGLVGPRMLYPDGTSAHAIRHVLPGLRDEMQRIADRLGRNDSRNIYPDDAGPVDVGLLIAACVMGRTSQLQELGGFNPEFFFYGEDIDLCKRLHSHGLRTVTVPSAQAIHDQNVAPDRRPRGRDFSTRILDARDRFYRIWLPRLERMAINLWRAFGLSDQPFRFSYHIRKAFYDGPSLTALRQPPRLVQADSPVGGSPESR